MTQQPFDNIGAAGRGRHRTALRSSLAVALVLLLSAGRGWTQEDPLHKAKLLYLEGKREYELQRYEIAYRLFERAFENSARPALLFNMASCLSALNRPREAADKLRAYLSRVPNEPERAAIENRIAALDEIGKPSAGDATASGGAGPPARGAATSDPERAALEERIRVLEEKLATDASQEASPPSRRGLAIGLGVTGGLLLLGGAITLGVLLGRGHDYTPSSYGGGPLQATP